LDADGDTICTALPIKSPLNSADRAYFQRARQTRNFAVGDYQIGRVTGKATVNFGYPILGEAGQVQAVVFAALELDWLKQLAAKAQLPQGSVLLVIDRQGTVVVRHPNPQNWVGQSLPEAPIVKAILAQGEGTSEVPGLDGIPRIYAFTPMSGELQNQDAYVSIGIPKSVAFAEANRLLAFNLSGLGLVTLLALVAAWVGSDLFVLRQVKSLVRTTQRLSDGDLNARTGLPHQSGEFSQLACAFDGMAEALARRDAAIAQLNQDLQRRVNELQTLFEVIPISIAIAEEPQCHQIRVNPALAQLLQISLDANASSTPPSPEPQPPFKVYRNGRELPGDELPLRYAAAHAVEVRDVEIDIVREDGAMFNLYGYAAPLLDEQGKPRGAVSAFLDITERKQAETETAQLLAREQKARQEAEAAREQIVQILESITDGFVAFECEWCFTYINQEGARTLGRSLEELIGKNVWKEFPELSGTSFGQLFQRAVAEGLPLELEDYYAPFNAWFVVRAYPSAAGLSFYFLNVTTRKRAEEEREQLLARERQYTSQLHGLTAAALAINSALSIEEVLQVITEQARSIIGAHQSVTSMTVNENWAQAINAVSLSDKYAQWRDYDEMPDGSGIYACICHTNRPMRMTQAQLEAHPRWRGFGKETGKHPPMRGWLAAPLIGRDGHNIGLIQLSDKYEGEFTEEDEAVIVQLAQMASVAIENTRLYEAEQQPRSQAETANRLKDEFLAVLSHELRSPLNPILGWSKLLQSRKFDQAKTTYALETIERNAKLQSQLIEDLLDVSRILRGKVSLNVCAVDLASIIEAALETVRLAAEAKSIVLTTVLASNVGRVLGDANRLQQVVWNLLSNAVKFTPTGGRVEVRLLFSRELNASDSALIQVSDTGKGINPDFLPYVFDYFRQENSTTTRVFGGLGLGLAIVRHLVELHGGTVFAESPGVDLGATFTVMLPLMKDEGGRMKDETDLEPSSLIPHPLQGVRVLIVDDEVDTRKLLVFILEEYGASVRAVASAGEALEAFALKQPDILLSDIGMPETDGYSLIRTIRSLPPEQGGQIPAIALTAYAGETDHQQILKAGFQRHVTKPVEPAQLAAVIADLVGTQ